MFQNLYFKANYMVLVIDGGGLYFIRHNIFLEDQMRYVFWWRMILYHLKERTDFFKESVLMAQVTRTIFGCFVIFNWISFKCLKVVARFEVWHGRENISSRVVFIYYSFFIYTFSGFCATHGIDISISNAKWKENHIWQAWVPIIVVISLSCIDIWIYVFETCLHIIFITWNTNWIGAISRYIGKWHIDE